MSLFSRKPKPDFIAACVDDPVQGYKRIKLSTYRDKYAYDGIRNLGRSQIRSVAFVLGDADGSSGKVRSASVEIVDRDEVYLYIK